MIGQRLLANYGDGFIRREIVLVVTEHEQVERGDEAVGRVAGDEVNLGVLESAGEEAEVHDAGRGGEAQAVGCDQALIAVGTLHEFVAESGTPLRSVGGGLRKRLQMQAAGVVAANLDGEGIVETEWRAQ